MMEEDLYRLGNSISPRLDHVREEIDVQTYERNGIRFVQATGEGISLLTESRIATLKRGLALENTGKLASTGWSVAQSR